MSKIDTKNSKSNLDCISDELLTELTPKEGALVQGGKKFTLMSVKALKTSETVDELSVRFNGSEIFYFPFVEGEGVIEIGETVNFNGSGKLELVEEDTWPNPDDEIAGHFVDNTHRESFTLKMPGNNSEYDVSFSVTG